MPIIKSAIKRNRQNEKRKLANKSFKSSTRTAMKKVFAAVEANDFEAAKNALPLAHKKLDKLVAKKIAKKNFAARQKSRLDVAVNSIAK